MSGLVLFTGYWCSTDSPSLTQHLCNSSAFYCPSESSTPSLVPNGWFSKITLIHTQDAVYDDIEACQAGSFCLSGIRENCSAGSYSSSSQQSKCIACERGTWSVGGATCCELCPAGSIAPGTSATTCIQCEEGQFGASAINCEVCAAGRASSTVGQALCDQCEAGYACPIGSNSTRQLTCGAGTYSTGGVGICTPCAAGTFTSLTGSTNCAVCGTGRYSPAAGADLCLRCIEPQVVNDNGRKCDLITCDNQPGYWANTTHGNATCIPCPIGSISSDLRCSVCPTGTYTAVEARTTCHRCTSSGIDCYGGLVRSKPGYWLALEGNDTVQSYVCSSDACSGYKLVTENQCPRGFDPSPSNRLCGACAFGYSEWNGNCVECRSVQAGMILALLVALIILVAFIYFIAQTESGSINLAIYFVQVSIASFHLIVKGRWMISS